MLDPVFGVCKDAYIEIVDLSILWQVNLPPNVPPQK